MSTCLFARRRDAERVRVPTPSLPRLAQRAGRRGRAPLPLARTPVPVLCVLRAAARCLRGTTPPRQAAEKLKAKRGPRPSVVFVLVSPSRSRSFATAPGAPTPYRRRVGAQRGARPTHPRVLALPRRAFRRRGAYDAARALCYSHIKYHALCRAEPGTGTE
ncbi:hypothetical protein HYPSUDRAFT_45662 [Hypholoma sublateritium FD-334 SS-4]|uniref:Uncharacterized protein n=1 Tax=Hypholoma sublateritium (strain FD-334 SS-4) TaxID=945553 RepID=A0A0D2KTY6_HYPSF|nr:hypothetical protein HYPSUDRAFT_45662 [Hypholoma sublateritium FD-334 SS-4]